MSIPFTCAQPLGSVPSFTRFQELALKHGVQLTCQESAGQFSHPKATGNYRFEKNGDIRGDFSSHHLFAKITGEFVLSNGQAEVTVTTANLAARMAEGMLRNGLMNGLKAFCDEFPPLRSPGER